MSVRFVLKCFSISKVLLTKIKYPKFIVDGDISAQLHRKASETQDEQALITHGDF